VGALALSVNISKRVFIPQLLEVVWKLRVQVSIALLYMKEKIWYLMSELWIRDLVFLFSFYFIFLFHFPFILFWVSFSFSLFWTWAKKYDVMTLLLSFLPPSYIIVPIRELANTLYSFASKHQNNQLELSRYYSMNIKINMHREHSAQQF